MAWRCEKREVEGVRGFFFSFFFSRELTWVHGSSRFSARSFENIDDGSPSSPCGGATGFVRCVHVR